MKKYIELKMKVNNPENWKKRITVKAMGEIVEEGIIKVRREFGTNVSVYGYKVKLSSGETVVARDSENIIRVFESEHEELVERDRKGNILNWK